MYKSTGAFPLSVLILCVAGAAFAGPSALSRQTAKELLDRHPRFQRIELELFRQQPIPLSEDIVGLQKSGFITVTQKPRDMGRRVEPTASAKGLIVSEDRFNFVLHVCSRQVTEITGIDLHKEGATATAHFKFAIGSSSALAGKIPSCTVKPGSEGIATFRRMDDGWRLIESSPPLNR